MEQLERNFNDLKREISLLRKSIIGAALGVAGSAIVITFEFISNAPHH